MFSVPHLICLGEVGVENYQKLCKPEIVSKEVNCPIEQSKVDS